MITRTIALTAAQFSRRTIITTAMQYLTDYQWHYQNSPHVLLQSSVTNSSYYRVRNPYVTLVNILTNSTHGAPAKKPWVNHVQAH